MRHGNARKAYTEGEGAPSPVRGKESPEQVAARRANAAEKGDDVWHFFELDGKTYYELLEHDGGKRMPEHDTTRRLRSMCKTTHGDLAAKLINDRAAIQWSPKGGAK